MRSPRHPTPFHQSPVFKGIRQFNSPIDEQPVTTFAYNDLEHHCNYVCPHCQSRLWKEERARRFNCCSNGECAIHKLRHVPAHVWDIYDSAEFRRNQRKYNSLFAFTALSAKGLPNQTWTQPIGRSMLTMHGRAYHRIFDLQQHYAGMNLSNSSRYYMMTPNFICNLKPFMSIATQRRHYDPFSNKTSHGPCITEVLSTRCCVTIAFS